MHRVFARLLLLAIPATPLAFAQEKNPRAERWEKEIAGLEKRQLAAKHDKGGIVFVGSSTIRLWDTAKAFPERKPINSGFGGSEIRDSTMFAERIVLIHEPRTIVMYAGDNDINSGRKPEQVAEDFRAFVEVVHKKLPKTRIHFIAIKPSISRWKQFETQKKTNELVKEICNKDERLNYIDIVGAMLGEDGQPKADLLVKDGLHMSPKGYEIFNDAVRKAVK
jgi:lysophospholipase L1-like esterase